MFKICIYLNVYSMKAKDLDVWFTVLLSISRKIFADTNAQCNFMESMHKDCGKGIFKMGIASSTKPPILFRFLSFDLMGFRELGHTLNSNLFWIVLRFLHSVLSGLFQVAIPIYHWLGGFVGQHLFLTILNAATSKIKGSAEDPLPVSLSCYVLTSKQGRVISLGPVIRAIISFKKALLL